MYYVGLDAGSGTVKAVVMDKNRNIIFETYRKNLGQPIKVASEILEEIEREFGDNLSGITCTGTAGKTISKILGSAFVNEIMAHAKATTYYHPEVKTIIDIGGEDSKMIFISHERGRPEIEEFALNTLCAAGTGAFLEQQAARLGYSIEEFSQLALKARNIPRIAGRCTVFAKSDMIHLQQAAVPDEEIIAGLCYAIIRNLKSNLAKGREVFPPIAFQGGVAANLGVRRAIKDIFNLREDELIIPEHFKIMGAIGAALYGLEGKASSEYRSSSILKEYLASRSFDPPRHKPLYPCESLKILERLRKSFESPQGKEVKEVYLGIDVGSVSTKIVAIDKEGNIVAKTYLFHHGKPLESIKKALFDIKKKLPEDVEVKGVGTTGSGRYLVGDFVGADVIRNEITAQARGAMHLNPEVDTIFEIGGQDSKYIYLEKGSIVEFTMNKACAAGTGSFLQEQAVKLGVPIENFGEIALKSEKPVKMGERCTVFMQSDLLHYQQQGISKEDLIGGLCYSIVYNYLNKVVEKRRIGKTIFFQGAVAFNQGVVAAFEKVLGKPVIVPPHNEVTGALGMALLAKEEIQGKTRFRGFDLAQVNYSITTFECQGCPNRCEIQKVIINGGEPYFYGGRCDKYEVDYRKPPEDLPNPIQERYEKLRFYADFSSETGFSQEEVIGIPVMLQFFEYLPLFATFFKELGFKVVLSDPTSKEIIKSGCEISPVEACFPIKIAYGHIKNLIEKGIKTIFVPQITDLPAEAPEFDVGKVCPYVQSVCWTLKAVDYFKNKKEIRFLHPVLHLGRPKEVVLKELKNLAKLLNRSFKEVKKAWGKGLEAQKDFKTWLKRKGREYLERYKDDIVVVLIGRPYNVCDPGANLGIHYKLRKLGVLGIPVDMLPLEEVKERKGLDNMYWEYGQRFLLAAHYVRERENLFPIFFTNFSCGPDSFIEHFFGELLNGKPWIEIEVDEHSAEAGVLTRIEAFLDSIRDKKKSFPAPEIKIVRARPEQDRTIYIPYMVDHARIFAAAFRACGINAEVLPEPDEEALELGRKYTSGKECYPTILTTGDLIKLINRKDFSPEKSIFFMPNSGGPCRFGQYNRLHQKILRELGVDMPVYSLDQDMGLYEDLNIMGRDFIVLAWEGILASDILDKFLRETRPYARDKEKVDKLYEEALRKLEESVEKREPLLSVLLEYKDKFLKLKEDGEEKPVVGVVGEIYVRSNRFANENLYRTLEDMGLEVWLPPLSEWIYFINYTSKEWAKKLGLFKTYLKYSLEMKFLRWKEEKFVKYFEDLLRTVKEPPVEEVVKLAEKFISKEYEGGEVILSTGKAYEFLRKRCAGIVNVIPFACMPGNVVTALLKIMREGENYKVPCLTVLCDGQRSMGTKMRIEAFVEQVKEFAQNVKN